MSKNDYTVTMPYKDFLKYQENEKELKELKDNIIACFHCINNDIVNLNINGLKRIGIKLLPLRFQDANFIEIKK